MTSRHKNTPCAMHLWLPMMTSSNGNISRVTGHLCEEFTGPRWIPRTNTSGAELWCFPWSASESNGWVNNREAGDLRRYRAHYDVTVMQHQTTIKSWTDASQITGNTVFYQVFQIIHKEYIKYLHNLPLMRKTTGRYEWVSLTKGQ